MIMYTVTMARGVPDKWRSVPVLLLCTLSPWQGLYLASGGQYLYSCCVHCHHGKGCTWQVVSTYTHVHHHRGKECTCHQTGDLADCLTHDLGLRG